MWPRRAAAEGVQGVSNIAEDLESLVYGLHEGLVEGYTGVEPRGTGHEIDTKKTGIIG